MKPFDTIIPARPVQVMNAEIWTHLHQQELRFTLQASGQIQNHTLMARSIDELIARLSCDFGFDLDDARHIVAHASHPKPALN